MSPESVLRPRRDVAWQQLDDLDRDGTRLWSVYDPLSRSSYRCAQAERWLYQQFDGRRSLRTIHLLSRETQHPISLQALIGLARILAERSLVRPVDQNLIPAVEKKSGQPFWLGWIQSSVSWRMRGINPERALCWLAPHTHWLFSKIAVQVWSGLAVLVAILVLADSSRLMEQATLWDWLMRPNSGGGLLVIFLATRAIHELGHALVLTRHGGRCPDIGLIFMLGAPCVYCDVSDSWRFSKAWHRAAVASGGMYLECIVSVLAGLVWLATTDGCVNTLALQTMIICSISTVLINANPLMRFDGYYILSDLLGEPNLRAKSDRELFLLAEGLLLGHPKAAQSTTSIDLRQGSYAFLLAGYALVGLVYRLGLSFFMAHLLTVLYSGWSLAWIGRAFAAILLFSWWVVPTMKFMLKLFHSANSRWRRLRLASLSAAIVFLACTVPIPCRQYATGRVQPVRMQGLYAPQSARLATVIMRSGQPIAAGEVAFELADIQPELRAIESEHAAKIAQVQLVSLKRQRYFTSAESVDLSAVEAAALSAAKQADHARAALESLKVRAAFDGQLMSLPAPMLRDIDNRSESSESPLWLEPQAVGRYVQAGTMLGAVCSSDQIVVVPLDDEQLKAVTLGTPTRIALPVASGRVMTSRVSAIVRLEQVDSVTRLLSEMEPAWSSNAAQATEWDERPRTSAGYAALIPLSQPEIFGQDSNALAIRVNARADVAFVVAPSTLSQCLSDWMRRNLRWMLP